MPSKFATIPSEAVASHADAAMAVLSSLKSLENRDICLALLDKAIQYDNYEDYDGKNIYRASAYRRVAIIIAAAEKPIISSENVQNFRHCCSVVGLPYHHSSTSTFVYNFIRHAHLEKELATNKYLAFPPSWRDNLTMDDERIALAVDMIHFRLLPNDRDENKFKNIPRNVNSYYRKVAMNVEFRQAHEFYYLCDCDDYPMFLDAIHELTGYDCDIPYF